MAEALTNSEKANLCDEGVNTYIKDKNKEVVSHRITEGMSGAVFATGLYLLFGGYNTFDYRMVLAPLLAGAAYSFVGIRQSKSKESDYRYAFEKVCSNLRTETDDDDSE